MVPIHWKRTESILDLVCPTMPDWAFMVRTVKKHECHDNMGETMQPRVNVITLGVKDHQASLRFYWGGLGWIGPIDDNVAFFPLNGIVLSL